MATIDYRLGQIRDRSVGYKPMCYCVNSKAKKFLQECLKAHEKILKVLAPQARAEISPKEVKSAVLLYVSIDDSGRQELLKKLAMSGYGAKAVETPLLEELANQWLEQKMSQGASERLRKVSINQKTVIMNFFSQAGLRKPEDLKPETAYQFLEWRRKTSYGAVAKPVISASTLKHELQVLRQIAKIASKNGWASYGIWDDVRVKATAGVDVKVIEPLPVDTQKRMMEILRGMRPELHDAVLLLLVTGMRVGEFENLKPEWLRSNAIALHGDAVGSLKPSTGKTASAARTIPICPTLAKIFERGHIFRNKLSDDKIRGAFKRSVLGREVRDVHPHRLRHTFAVNKLLSQTVSLQMVSYQLGHSDISLTANLYGRFEPKHFMAGFDEVIKERRELVDWLENKYFEG